MMLFIIAPVDVLWLHFMFFLQNSLWNVLIVTCLCWCGGKGRFGGSKSWHFSWSIHREQRWGEKSFVIETVAPMIVTESPPREYSRSSYLSISFYLTTYLSRWFCHATIPSSSLNLGQFFFLCSSLSKILCMPVPSFGSLHILICLLLFFFLFLSFLRTVSSNSWSSVSLSLPKSHCGCFIPLVPSSISISRCLSTLFTHIKLSLSSCI